MKEQDQRPILERVVRYTNDTETTYYIFNEQDLPIIRENHADRQLEVTHSVHSGEGKGQRFKVVFKVYERIPLDE